MPSLPYTVGELVESAYKLMLAAVLDSSDEELADDFVVDALEPLARRNLNAIGPERLSLARLQREADEHGFDGDDMSSATYQQFGFRLSWLYEVVHALKVPPVFDTISNHKFSGEEGVLILLRRWRHTGGLHTLTMETGRSIPALSECVQYMVEHVHREFPHLVDHRSFTSWANHFEDFAEAFREHGLPIDNLIGFIDGKLWPCCRPGKYQEVLYSGHKRIHGIKVQGIVFPNGMQPYPYGPINGARHDSFVLSQSRIVEILHDVCRGGQFETTPGGLGKDYVLFGDSAYPISAFLWRMYKGIMTAAQTTFNRDMAPARVTVEWGFGKIVNLWPFLDYRKKSQVLLSPVGLYFPVANVLTNMHTCLSRGNIVSLEFELEPPSLEDYMNGGPYN